MTAICRIKSEKMKYKSHISNNNKKKVILWSNEEKSGMQNDESIRCQTNAAF